MKFDKAKERALIRLLDSAAKKYGLIAARHAINKWAAAQRNKVSLNKKEIALDKLLAEVSKRLQL